jgi:hypothetical protein
MLVLGSLALQGCAEKETRLPETSRLTSSIPRVDNAPQSPCWQQRQIAKQNAWFDSQKAKKPVVYQAPCDVDKPEPQAKTS